MDVGFDGGRVEPELLAADQVLLDSIVAQKFVHLFQVAAGIEFFNLSSVVKSIIGLL